MRWMRWATYLWPGLPQLWHEGSWSGLLLAIGFSLLLNLLLLSSLVWVELLEPAVLRFSWLALGAAWIVSLALLSWKDGAREAITQSTEQQDLFRQALVEYLKGAWFEAESLWRQVVDRNPRDVDARLMLVTLLRRSKRSDEAWRQLEELERIEASAHWRDEIQRERLYLNDLSASGQQEIADGAPAPAADQAENQAESADEPTGGTISRAA